MEELERIIDYLMKRVLEQQERIAFLEKHIDSQNDLVARLFDLHSRKEKMSKEEFDEWLKEWRDEEELPF